MIIKVRLAMKTHPTTVDADVSVSEAARKMIQSSADTLIVLENNMIKGTVDLRNVLRYTYTQGFRPNQTPVSEITKSNIVFVRPNTSLEDALTIMIERKQDTLPVVDNELVGSINIHDLLKAQPQTKPLEHSVIQA
jgi:signal-transduction protein with cAMP-binding, CBS, and nucleotidyltransferase domain